MRRLIVSLVSAFVVIGVIIASQIGGMTRFEHRTLSCSNPIIGPFEVIMNKKKVGENIRLSQPKGDRFVPITTVDEHFVTATVDDLTLVINFDRTQVRVQKIAKISRSKCVKTEFSM